MSLSQWGQKNYIHLQGERMLFFEIFSHFFSGRCPWEVWHFSSLAAPRVPTNERTRCRYAGGISLHGKWRTGTSARNFEKYEISVSQNTSYAVSLKFAENSTFQRRPLRHPRWSGTLMNPEHLENFIQLCFILCDT